MNYDYHPWYEFRIPSHFELGFLMKYSGDNKKGEKLSCSCFYESEEKKGDETREHALNINWTFFNFHPFPFKSGAKNALNINWTFILHPSPFEIWSKKSAHWSKRQHLYILTNISSSIIYPVLWYQFLISWYSYIKSNPWYQLLRWFWGVGLYWRKKRHYDLDPLPIFMFFNQQSLSILGCWP